MNPPPPAPVDDGLRLPPPPVYPRIPGTGSPWAAPGQALVLGETGPTASPLEDAPPGGPSFAAPLEARPARDPRPKVAGVALVAALIGALVGSGSAAAVLSQRTADSGRAVAQAPAPAPIVQAPTVEVEGGPEDRVAVIAAAVLPSVVQIDITDGMGGGNGSGVIYRSDGYIITNNHVVAGADTVQVVFADRTRVLGEVVGADAFSDLAVVKVDRKGLPAIQIGDSGDLQVGELAVAVGSPFGLDGSVTAGVVSALNRVIDVGEVGGAPVSLANAIQTDAPFNPGNSGGALVSGDARLIGINSAIFTSGAPANAGVGFAIPSSTAVDVADELIATGVVHHPFLGVAGTTLNPLASERLGVDAGAVIESVEPGTPAADAGLRVDDVVTELDGAPITSMDALVVAIRDHDVGDTVEITYIRDGEATTVEVTLADRPS